jgi:hypothetical protein
LQQANRFFTFPISGEQCHHRPPIKIHHLW